ncbi:MAG: glycosyltransferase [Rikenellaceae bacterium]
MKKIILLTIANSGISGVTRYIEAVSSELKHDPRYDVYVVELLHPQCSMFCCEYNDSGLTKITIPLPLNASNIIEYEYFSEEYSSIVVDILSGYFDSNDDIVLHINTLNCISVATDFKTRFVNTKIITHLHCIPWKGLYAKHPDKFYKLYNKYYVEKSAKLIASEFATNHTEIASYNHADKIICVTQCASEFLQRVMDIDSSKITVIQNGMADCYRKPIKTRSKTASSQFKLLYVGSVIPSKGVEYLLHAAKDLVDMGFNVELLLAGTADKKFKNQLESDYSIKNIKFLGQISFDKLKKLYTSCDVGVLPSLQEQCSYAAIEMAMFSMPIIVTAVDGLDEMFNDGVDCLKVQTVFKDDVLAVDVSDLTNKIKQLITDIKLREALSSNARKRYLANFTSELMVTKTNIIYL